MEADVTSTNGERYNQRYCQTFEFRGGLMAEVFEFFGSTLAQTAL
jgi:ketosteroid isomerase-like protein